MKVSAKKTITVAGRIDLCSFATLARAYETEGLIMRSKSDILWQAVQQLSAVYSRKHDTEPFEDVRDAIDYMERIGLSLGSNSRAERELVMAKMSQDAEDDYGLDEAVRIAKTQSIRGEKRADKEERAEREAYRQMVDVLKQAEQPIPTFEEYREGLKRVRAMQQEEGVVRETVDAASFEKKEADRLRAEKEAYAAMGSMRSTSGSGSGEGDD